MLAREVSDILHTFSIWLDCGTVSTVLDSTVKDWSYRNPLVRPGNTDVVDLRRRRTSEAIPATSAEPTYVIVDTRTTAPLALVDRWVATHISIAVSMGEEALCARDMMKRTYHRTRVERCRLALSGPDRSSPRPPCLRFADDISCGLREMT